MTTIYRVWRCGRCGRRTYQAAGRSEQDRPRWCADCATMSWHIYEGIELA